jgi:peptidase YpeB-like protein
MRAMAVVAGIVAWIGASSLASAQAPPTDAQIKQNLESQGYTSVEIGKHEENHIDVKAMKGGKKQKLEVNPTTGQIRADTDKNEDEGRR